MRPNLEVLRPFIERGKEFIRERRIPEIRVYRFNEESRSVVTRPTYGGLCLPLFVREDTVIDTPESLSPIGQNITNVSKHGIKMYEQTTEYEAEAFVETTDYDRRTRNLRRVTVPVRIVRFKAIKGF